MAKKDVKKHLLNHSEAKVRLLGEYLKRYLNVICNDGFTKKINVFDLFCGEGVYEDGGEGSPLVIMRAIKDIHFINTANLKSIPKIDCFFNDIEPAKTKNVEKALKNKSLYYEEFGGLKFSSIDYKDLLIRIEKYLKTLHNEKAFIFIDPYEYKHIRISDIKKLMSSKKAEVLLWLPTQFMYRFEKNGTPRALKDFIEEIIPFEKWKKSENVWTFVNQMKDGFQNAMGTDYFIDNFTIQKDNNTVFCLFFFTSHIKGFEKMLEAKWEIDTEQGKGWNYSGNLPSLFFDYKMNPLETKLQDFLEKTPRTNGEIYEFTLRQGFLPKHTNEILYNWQNGGNITVTLENGKKARKKAFYNAYKYYKSEDSKVTIKKL